MDNEPAFLGVERSLTGRRWVGLNAPTDRMSLRITQETGVPAPVARVLATAGVQPDGVNGYLNPKLRDLMPDPLELKDAGRAALRLIEAVNQRQPVAIVADYDVDGAASAALLIDWFRAFGIVPDIHVPDRIEEGYGPSVSVMRQLADRNALIICVDCGTLAHGPVSAAAGADVLVLDHHLGEESLPAAHSIVNPNRQDESGSLGHLCAAAVVFMVLVEANRRLKCAPAAVPDLLAMLDLVALATVADVAPLIGLNRAFVHSGLAVLRRRERVGLRALSDVAGLDAPPTSRHLGFVLGPRLNAAGRIGRSDLATRLLSTQDENEALSIATELNQLNRDRRDLSENTLVAARSQARDRGLDGPLVWAASEDWHPGIVGLVAGQLATECNRPAVVIGFRGPEGRGSGRSIPGIDLGSAVATCVRDGLLTTGGGHRMAAGLSVERDQLVPAMDRLSGLVARQGSGRTGPADLRIASVVTPGAATVELAELLESAGPYGASAPPPRVAIAGVQVRYRKPVGSDENHLRLTFQGEGSQDRIRAILFRAFDGPLGPALFAHEGGRFHVAGRLEIGDWGGRHVQLVVEDAVPISA
ncbi:MAG: single-stranded-DNA-specific exonuclease RecJ [Paracoccaceae bacterium]|nr:single-stranded-DNA-specific exonuclease RecJ [Paracoccaceae bacterium]